MTAVIDIDCPECGQTESVQKEGLATYVCRDCDIQFDQSDVEP